MSITATRLAAVLQQLQNAGRLSRKAVQFTIDDSTTGTARLFAGQRELQAHELAELIADRDIDASVRLSIANALLADSDLRVISSGAASVTQSLRGSLIDGLETACRATSLAKHLSDVCEDGLCTTDESAATLVKINELRAMLDTIESNIAKHTARPAMRVG